MHDQRLAAAGGAHERQLIQLVYGVRLKIDQAKRFGSLCTQPVVQIRTKAFRVSEIPIQIDFCEQQSDILEIFPPQSSALFAHLPCVAADI